MGGAQVAQDVHAVHVGQAEVQDDGVVGGLVGEGGKGGAARGCGVHREAALVEMCGEHFAERCVVFHQEKFHKALRIKSFLVLFFEKELLSSFS
jgi:hypothetical protein